MRPAHRRAVSDRPSKHQQLWFKDKGGQKSSYLEQEAIKGSGLRPIYFGIRDFCRADRRPVRWCVFCVLPGGAGVPTAGRRRCKGPGVPGCPPLGEPCGRTRGHVPTPRSLGEACGVVLQTPRHAGWCEMKLSNYSQVLSWAAVFPSRTNVLFTVSESGYGFWLLR